MHLTTRLGVPKGSNYVRLGARSRPAILYVPSFFDDPICPSILHWPSCAEYGRHAPALLMTQNMSSNPLALNTRKIEDSEAKASKGEKRGEWREVASAVL